jgi:two-component system response regulator PilR (NtrC family)
MATILVVDDERSLREVLTICLGRAGHEVVVAESAPQALATLSAREIDLVITDIRMPGGLDGLGLLGEVKKRSPETQVVMITAYATAETAVDAMKRGAYDYVIKPFKVDEILVVVDRALERQALVRDNQALRTKVLGRYRLASLLGKSAAMQRVFDLIRKIAATRTNVLITGESGTGKELVARALHAEGPRASRPFVAVNCGALPDTLIESELFGYVKGAFTGANAAKQGLFEAADTGTLFLDEIAELGAAMQVKLLRAIQERKVKPVGGVEEKTIDVRLVAATNRNLEEEVVSGGFRRDLYYRLNVIQVHLPPLRQRSEDVPLLADHFLRRFSAEMDKRITGIAPDALAALVSYNYPGNVRELENILERAATLETQSVVTRGSLPDLGGTPTDTTNLELPAGGVDLDRILADYERDFLLRGLKQTGGVRKEAARLLGITFRSLRYRLQKLGIEAGPDEPEEAIS